MNKISQWVSLGLLLAGCAPRFWALENFDQKIPLRGIGARLSLTDFPVLVSGTSRNITIEELPDGRPYSLHIFEDQIPSSIHCENLPAYAWTEGGSLQFIPRHGLGGAREQITCYDSVGPLTISLHFKGGHFELVTGPVSVRPGGMHEVVPNSLSVGGNRVLWKAVSERVAQAAQYEIYDAERKLRARVGHADGGRLTKEPYMARLSPRGQYVVFQSSVTNYDSSVNVVAGSGASGASGAAGDGQIYVQDLDAESPAGVLVSSVDGTVANRAADELAYDPQVADDGTVLFTTSASNFPVATCTVASGGSGGACAGMYRKNLAQLPDAPEFVELPALQTRLSGNARWAVFSDATTLPGSFFNGISTESTHQVFIKDLTLTNATPILVSSTNGTNGGAGNGLSRMPEISPDGRYVTFITSAQNLGAHAASYSRLWSEIVWVDLQNPAQLPKVVSSTDGTSAGRLELTYDRPHLSADGMTVVFTAHLPNTDVLERVVYAKRMDQLAQPLLVISSLDGTMATAGAAQNAYPSADGRYVYFESSDPMFEGGRVYHVYVKDTAHLEIPPRVIDSESPEITYDHWFSMYSTITGDGLKTSYVSRDSNGYVLNVGATHTYSALANSDDGTVATRRTVSFTDSRDRMNADGRYLIMRAFSGDFEPSLSPRTGFVVKDLEHPVDPPVLISSMDATWANQTANYPYTPRMSSDGRYAVLPTQNSGHLAPGTQGANLVRKDLQNLSAAPVLVTSATGGNIGTTGGLTYAHSDFHLSGDGRYVVFISSISALANGNGNGYEQVYVKDMDQPTVLPEVISSINGSYAGMANANCDSVRISTDGRYVFFRTQATNLIAGGGAFATAAQIYVVDRQDVGRVPHLVSTLNGTVAGASTVSINRYSVSPNGEYIAFLSDSPNFNGGSGANVFRKSLSDLTQTPDIVTSVDNSLATAIGVVLEIVPESLSVSNLGSVMLPLKALPNASREALGNSMVIWHP